MVSLEFWPMKYTKEISTLSRLLHKKKQKQKNFLDILFLSLLNGDIDWIRLKDLVEDGATEKGTLIACVLSCVQIFVT